MTSTGGKLTPLSNRFLADRLTSLQNVLDLAWVDYGQCRRRADLSQIIGQGSRGRQETTRGMF
jgi:hypothetical protein